MLTPALLLPRQAVSACYASPRTVLHRRQRPFPDLPILHPPRIAKTQTSCTQTLKSMNGDTGTMPIGPRSNIFEDIPCTWPCDMNACDLRRFAGGRGIPSVAKHTHRQTREHGADGARPENKSSPVLPRGPTHRDVCTARFCKKLV